MKSELRRISKDLAKSLDKIKTEYKNKEGLNLSDNEASKIFLHRVKKKWIEL